MDQAIKRGGSPPLFRTSCFISPVQVKMKDNWYPDYSGSVVASNIVNELSLKEVQ